MSTLKPKDLAPPFTLPDQNGKSLSLSDLRGRNILLYFYPKADTPGCTTQACSVRDAQPDLSDLNVAVIGISPDQPDKQQKFDKQYNLGFPLLSDPDHEIAEAYGVWAEKRRFGKTYMGINRSAFLIDQNGRILSAWYNVKPEDTAPNVQKALQA
ncbi:thioredoxin-dependent thiol peroxidase [bacterium]|nr:thioredoxin-dependent thiol peroxidase [bacterium]